MGLRLGVYPEVSGEGRSGVVVSVVDPYPDYFHMPIPWLLQVLSSVSVSKMTRVHRIFSPDLFIYQTVLECTVEFTV